MEDSKERLAQPSQAPVEQQQRRNYLVIHIASHVNPRLIIRGRAHDKHYGAATVGSPNRKEPGSCKEFGKRVASLLTKLKS